MEAFYIFYVVWSILFVFAVARTMMASRYVNKRIDEVFASDNWAAYDIDIDGTYNRALWDMRKWTYRQYFPEVVK
jgi:hypothetical protein